MFVHFNDKLTNVDVIHHVDCSSYLKNGFVRVVYVGEHTECVYGIEATNLIMRLCPEFMEGKRVKFIKHAWAIHNLVGHPVMQILSWFKLYKTAMHVHDKTIPAPKVHYEFK